VRTIIEAVPWIDGVADASREDVDVVVDQGRHKRLDGETGQIAPGYRADMVLVESDPLADLGRRARPVLVLQAGRVVPRASD